MHAPVHPSSAFLPALTFSAFERWRLFSPVPARKRPSAVFVVCCLRCFRQLAPLPCGNLDLRSCVRSRYITFRATARARGWSFRAAGNVLATWQVSRAATRPVDGVARLVTRNMGKNFGPAADFFAAPRDEVPSVRRAFRRQLIVFSREDAGEPSIERFRTQPSDLPRPPLSRRASHGAHEIFGALAEQAGALLITAPAAPGDMMRALR